MTVKAYPLAIEELREENRPAHGVYSKGHHDPIAFLSAVGDYYGTTRRFEVSADQVRQCYYRVVPCAEGGGVLIQAKQGSHGAFPVTVVEWRS